MFYVIGVLAIIGGLAAAVRAQTLPLAAAGVGRVLLGALVLWKGRTLGAGQRQLYVESPPLATTIQDALRDVNAHARLSVKTSEGSVRIHVPSPLPHLLAGLGCVGIIIGFMAFLYDQVQGQLKSVAGSPSDYSVAVVAVVFLVPLSLLVYPWWWFLGGETFDLSPSRFRYKPAFGIGKTISWSELRNLRLNFTRILGLGYRFKFDDPHVGMQRYMARHLRDTEAPHVLSVIRSYQALHDIPE